MFALLQSREEGRICAALSYVVRRPAQHWPQLSTARRSSLPPSSSACARARCSTAHVLAQRCAIQREALDDMPSSLADAMAQLRAISRQIDVQSSHEEWLANNARLRSMTKCGFALVEMGTWWVLGKQLEERGAVKSSDTNAAPDPEGVAVAFARCCKCALRSMAEGTGQPDVAQSMFLDAVFIAGSYISELAKDCDAYKEVVAALRDVLAACETVTSAQLHVFDTAAFMAHFTIGVSVMSSLQTDRDRAARHFRRALAIAQRAGPLLDKRAQSMVDLVARNLAALEAKTPEELQRITQASRDTGGGGRGDHDESMRLCAVCSPGLQRMRQAAAGDEGLRRHLRRCGAILRRCLLCCWHSQPHARERV